MLLRRGSVWRETLVMTSSGAPDHPIVVGTYGDGAAPVINGANVTTNWVLHDAANHVWSTPVGWTPSAASPALDVVFFGGVRGTKRTSVASVRVNGDWYWNPSNQTLYVYSVNLPTHVETAARDYGVVGRDDLSVQYIVIENLEIRQANSKSVLIGYGNHYWTLRNLICHHNGRLDDVEDGGHGNDRVGISVRRCNGTLITGCTVYESGENGIQITEGSGNIIERCTIWNAHHHAIDLKGSTEYVCQDNVIRYNRIYATPEFSADVNGIALVNEAGTRSLLNTLIHHNIVYDIPDSGLLVFGSNTGDTKVFNNTFVNCRSHNVHLLNGAGTLVMKNNIGVSNRAGWCPTLLMQNAVGKSSDYNCWLNLPANSDMIQVNGTDYRSLASYQSATGLDQHSLSSGAGFLDESSNDYHLTDSSHCLNAGTPVGLTEDFDGFPIPANGPVSIGAYQSVQSGSLTITQQPYGTRKAIAQVHSFRVGVSGGTGIISYQWYKDGAELNGATEQVYTTPPLTEADSGLYYVVVRDESGTSLTSASAYLEVGFFVLPALGPLGLFVLLALIVACRRRRAHYD